MINIGNQRKRSWRNDKRFLIYRITLNHHHQQSIGNRSNYRCEIDFAMRIALVREKCTENHFPKANLKHCNLKWLATWWFEPFIDINLNAFNKMCIVSGIALYKKIDSYLLQFTIEKSILCAINCKTKKNRSHIWANTYDIHCVGCDGRMHDMYSNWRAKTIIKRFSGKLLPYRIISYRIVLAIILIEYLIEFNEPLTGSLLKFTFSYRNGRKSKATQKKRRLQGNWARMKIHNFIIFVVCFSSTSLVSSVETATSIIANTINKQFTSKFHIRCADFNISNFIFFRSYFKYIIF